MPTREIGRIALDSETSLTGIPPEAWDYKLGNCSALEPILDQYNEKTPKDPTIRARFNTYRFADYTEKVIDLLGRVTRVSGRHRGDVLNAQMGLTSCFVANCEVSACQLLEGMLTRSLPLQV